MDRSLRFRRFTLRAGSRELLDDGVPVRIGARAFDLLVLLAAQPGKPVSKEQLLERVWPGLVVEENNVEVQIAALRRLLGRDAIATIPGRGYCFTFDTRPDADPAHAAGEAVAVAPAEPVGRAHDLQRIASLLATHGFVTLLGPGGIGKTCVARALAAREGSGAAPCWVDLAGVGDAGVLEGAVAQALAGDASAAARPADALWRTAGLRPRLVVLDSAEHLLEPVAALVRRLRSEAPALRLLVTSQQPLRVDGEQQVRLGPLSVPAPGDAPEGSDAERLFVLRARSLVPGFAIDAGNAAAVAEVCRALDGMPLALELAAARIPLLGAEGLRSRLGDALRLLTRAAGDAPPRQQALRAALAWSHGLLAPAEQTVLRRLAVFRGGFTLEAAQAVAADGDIDAWTVLDALDGLRDKSLVVAGTEPQPRLRLLDTTRLFAAERLAEAGELRAVTARHAVHHLALAEAAAADVARRGRGGSAWPALDRERDNVLAAVDACLQPGLDGGPALALRYAAALRYYWPSRGLIATGLSITRAALAAAPPAAEPVARVFALGSLKSLLEWSGDDEASADLDPTLRAAADASGDPALVAGACWGIGHTAVSRGRLEEALALFEEALARARACGSVRFEANALAGLARVARAQGRGGDVRRLVEEHLACCRRDSNGYNLALALIERAELGIDDGEEPAAVAALLAEARPLMEATGSLLLRQTMLEVLPSLCVQAGRWAAGVRLQSACDRLRSELGLVPNPPATARAARALARAEAALGAEACARARAEGDRLDAEAALAEGAAEVAAAMRR